MARTSSGQSDDEDTATQFNTSADCPCTLLTRRRSLVAPPSPSTLSAFRRSTRPMRTYPPCQLDDHAARQTQSQNQGRGDSSVSTDRNVAASTSQAHAQAPGGKGKGKNIQQDSAPLRSKRGRNDVEDTSTTTTTTDDDESSDAEEDVGEHNRPGPDSRNTSAEGVSWSYCILTLYDDSMSHVLNADHSRGLCASMTGKPSASRSARRTF